MRALVLILCSLTICPTLAAETPIRFSISDSWSMPLARIENNQPVDGILFDMMQSLARQVGLPAEYHVLARLRTQPALERGEVNVRCYASQAWSPGLSGNYTWSLPIVVQRDMLVGSAQSPATTPEQLPHNELVGTVLGYSYASLQALFDSRQLVRDDARSQELVLEKLAAGRYRYAVSNQLSLDWFNRTRPPEQRLRALATISEQAAGCIVRNDSGIPVQFILRTLVRMEVSGELQRIIDKYTRPLDPE